MGELSCRQSRCVTDFAGYLWGAGQHHAFSIGAVYTFPVVDFNRWDERSVFPTSPPRHPPTLTPTDKGGALVAISAYQ